MRIITIETQAWFLLMAIPLFLFLVVLGWKIIRRHRNPRAMDFPYVKNPALFSPAERSFLGVLEQAFGGDYRIYGKVRAADVVGMKPTADRKAWFGAFNRISAKHFDFILCAKDNLTIRCAIELNDKSHEASRRRERDAFLEGVCKAISLPFVQIQARREYSVSDVKKIVLAALKKDSVTTIIESEQPFSVGMVAPPRPDNRPWTIA